MSAPSDRKKKKKEKRPKLCMECGTGKVAARIDRKDKIYWLCRTCTIELQEIFDNYGTIHKGELPKLNVEVDNENEELEQNKMQVAGISEQYQQRCGKVINSDIEELRSHIDLMYSTCGFEGGFAWHGFDFEFNYLEFSAAVISAQLKFRSALWQGNMEKNRYANVLPCESTRVILSSLKDNDTGKTIPDTDYINANHLNGIAAGAKNRYLGVQGPLEHTQSDFWRMMWEQNASLVVMVTREVENERIKCARYWPEEEIVNDYEHLTVRMEEMTLKRDIIRRRFTMRNNKNGQERTVWHLQYIEWPDHGVGRARVGRCRGDAGARGQRGHSGRHAWRQGHGGEAVGHVERAQNANESGSGAQSHNDECAPNSRRRHFSS